MDEHKKLQNCHFVSSRITEKGGNVFTVKATYVYSFFSSCLDVSKRMFVRGCDVNAVHYLLYAAIIFS